MVAVGTPWPLTRVTVTSGRANRFAFLANQLVDFSAPDLRRRLELERRERGQWGKARKQLLLEFW